MSKRTVSQRLAEQSTSASDEPSPRPKHPRLEDTYPHPDPERFLQYPDISKHSNKQTPFQQPTQLISFSYNSSHTLEFNDSSLRYYVDPPPGAKLNYGYEHWIRKPDGRARIDGLLQAFSKAREISNVPLHDVGVVAWRGVITRILTSPYEEREELELNLMSVNGTLYLEEHLSDERLREKNNMEPKHRIQTYYGYAFESYCTSESPTPKISTKPSEPAGWGGNVDTNVQWCSVVRTKLGNTRLLIGGEVDCVRERYTYQTDTFVELKTSLAIRGARDEAKFEKKLLKFYFQSFLLGVPLPRMVRGKPGAWDPLICLAWGDRVMTFLKDVVRSLASEESSVWRVKLTPQKGVTVTMLDNTEAAEVQGGEDRVGFLPTWYWRELRTAGGVEPTTCTTSPLSAG
ncbi:hypothetical protein C0992_004324 [Termitomyces sp. T32_za158]|nr:hypothetical protein C0992_004324 [Termitomyces sp. T32_za158]